MPRPAVRRVLIETLIEARLHTDHSTRGNEWQQIERGYVGYHAQACYVIIDPATRKLLRKTEFTLDFKTDEQLFIHFLLGEPPYDK